LITIQNSIGQILLPHFCVIRNFDQPETLVNCPFDVSRLRGEYVALTHKYECARRLIPQPEYPKDAAANAIPVLESILKNEAEDEDLRNFAWAAIKSVGANSSEHACGGTVAEHMRSLYSTSTQPKELE
jgi:hypothetical protein